VLRSKSILSLRRLWFSSEYISRPCERPLVGSHQETILFRIGYTTTSERPLVTMGRLPGRSGDSAPTVTFAVPAGKPSHFTW